MIVRMTTLSAAPDGIVRPGEELELPDGQAMEMIRMGYAQSAETTGIRETQPKRGGKTEKPGKAQG